MGTETVDPIRTEPVQSYVLEDSLGKHEVVLHHGTMHANRTLIEQWRDTGDVLLREAFRYIHGNRDHLPIDVWHAILTTDLGDGLFGPKRMALACIQDNTVTIVQTDKDALSHEQQQIIQDADRHVLLSDEDRVLRQQRQRLAYDG